MNTKQPKQFTGHTPGPWRVERFGDQLEVIKAYNKTICSLTRGDGEADAALVAAAPELLTQRDALLSACKAVIENALHCQKRGYDVAQLLCMAGMGKALDAIDLCEADDLDHRDGPIVNEYINQDGIRTWEDEA